MKRRAFLIALGGVAVVGAAAAIALQWRIGVAPRLQIRLGEDRCRRCGMFISRLEFAAGLLLQGEQRWRFYDDVGCFASDYNDLLSAGKTVADARVFDYISKEELDAQRAYYVLADPKNLWTPMSYGVVAVGSRGEAENLAERFQGEVMDFWSMLSRFR
ncbi:hypothetical protein HRbin02_01139 [Candidatus Calditenuaceae archaeon HR02]|nr:hypothetical protein HRbin02_01139 [Candidatus Calditenuaceae archaeon HR02]